MFIRATLLAAFLVLPAATAYAAEAAATAPPASTAAPVAAPAPVAATATAESVLRDLYTAYFAKLNAGEPADMREFASLYFEPELASKFAAATSGEVAAIDFDIFIYAQDHEELTLDEVKRVLETLNKAIFEVRFSNGGDQEKLRFGLTKTGAAWKIADIEFPDGSSLLQMIDGAR